MSPVSRPISNDTSSLQQKIAELAAFPAVSALDGWFREHERQISQWQIEVATIPAPPFGEPARSEWLAAKFRELGLTTTVDAIGNVIGLRRGPESEAISISAHIDTVFPAGTPLNIRQEGKQLLGP